MNINLTPEIQLEIFRDKQKQYTMEMLEKLTPKIEYEPKQKDKNEEEESSKTEDKKDKNYINESQFTFESKVRDNSFNKTFSTDGFFDTLSNAGGNVKKAS